tara:strand:- start:79 stop:318 length:240 start_codon:yes stop_codon:yes gene_type:complete
MSIDLLATFLGWCTVLNVGFLLVVLVAMTGLGDWLGGLSARMFGVTEPEARRAMFLFFLQYRLVIITFNLVPYIALKIM